MDINENNQKIAEFMGFVFANGDELQALENFFKKINDKKKSRGFTIVEGEKEGRHQARDARYTIKFVSGGEFGKDLLTNPYYDGWDYHENWASLMPVIEKIENIPCDNQGNYYSVVLRRASAFISTDVTGHKIGVLSYHGGGKLNSAYSAVCQFINNIDQL